MEINTRNTVSKVRLQQNATCYSTHKCGAKYRADQKRYPV
jgi:hypothetical protein